MEIITRQDVNKIQEKIDYDKRNSIKYIGGLVGGLALSALFAGCGTAGNRQLVTPSVTIDQIVKPGKEGFLSDENIKKIQGAFPFKVQSTEQILGQLGNDITMLNFNLNYNNSSNIDHTFSYYEGLNIAKTQLNKDSIVYMFDPFFSFSKYGALAAMEAAAKNNVVLFGMNLYHREPNFGERNKLLTAETDKLQGLDQTFKTKRNNKAGVNERKILPLLLVYKNCEISDAIYEGPENPRETRVVAKMYDDIIRGSIKANGQSLSDIYKKNEYYKKIK